MKSVSSIWIGFLSHMTNKDINMYVLCVYFSTRTARAAQKCKKTKIGITGEFHFFIYPGNLESSSVKTPPADKDIYAEIDKSRKRKPQNTDVVSMHSNDLYESSGSIFPPPTVPLFNPQYNDADGEGNFDLDVTSVDNELYGT